MSRFDRRLKPQEFNNRQTYRRSSSPRPGEATCKLRPRNKNTGMLGSTLFMGDTTNPNRPSIEVIENAIASPSQNSEPVSSNAQTITMDNVSVKNSMLIEKLKTIRDPNIRIIYNHEIRLNTIEATVDCLDDIKCSEVLEEQKSKENLHVITNLNTRVDSNMQIIQSYNERFNKVTKNIETNSQKINKYDDLLNEKTQTLEKKIEKVLDQNLKDVAEMKTENEILKVKIESYKNILKNILNSDNENKDVLLQDIENL